MFESPRPPKGVPEDAMLIEGKWISSDHDNKVIVHEEISHDDSRYVQPETQPYYPPSTPRSEASFELKIVGNAPLSDLVRIAQPHTSTSQQQRGYPQYVPQQPVYTPAPTVPAYSYPNNSQYEPASPASSIMTEPMSPTPTPSANTFSNIQDRSTPAYMRNTETEEDTYETVTPPRTSKRMVAISALVAIALVSGPAIQASNSGEEAAEVCAKNGITDIFGNPGCFAAEFFNEFNAKNLFNVIPPEQNND
jgi:hypothetical protein